MKCLRCPIFLTLKKFNRWGSRMIAFFYDSLWPFYLLHFVLTLRFKWIHNFDPHCQTRSFCATSLHKKWWKIIFNDNAYDQKWIKKIATTIINEITYMYVHDKNNDVTSCNLFLKYNTEIIPKNISLN